jgi:hypothetical protein
VDFEADFEVDFGACFGAWQREGGGPVIGWQTAVHATVNQDRADLKNYFFSEIKALDDGIHGGPSYIR